MTLKDLNEIIVTKARKQGITQWENMRDYSEFAFKIVIDYIKKLGIVHPPLKIKVDPDVDLISITSSELRSNVASYELFYTTTDYAALEYPEEYKDRLKVYSIETSRDPLEIEDILDEAIEKVNVRVLKELIDKHFEDTSRPHIEYITKKYGFHVLQDTAKLRLLSYDEAVSLMEYVEKNSDDFPPNKIDFLRRVLPFTTKSEDR